MDLSRRRSSIAGGRGTPLPSVVAAGSVWESRMKIDEVRGGFKVFNGYENGGSSAEDTTATITTPTRPRKAQQSNVQTPKRKHWRSDTSEGLERSPIVHGVAKKSSITPPAKAKRDLRSEASKDIDRKSPVPRRIVKKKPDSDLLKEVDETGSPEKEDEEEEEESICKDFEVCPDEKTIAVDDVAVESDDDDDEVVVIDEEIEVVEIKEIKTEETKPEKVDDQIKEIKTEETKPEKDDDQIKEIKREETKPEKDDDQIKEIKAKDMSEVKRVNFERKLEVRLHNKSNNNNNNDVSNKSKIFHRRQSEPISMNVSRQPPVIKRATTHSSFPNKSESKYADSGAYQNFPESHSRLQSFVDLIMWKDISRSVFIFGIGTFTILSSSYTKDLNISFISVISYLCLVYLAAIFLFRSIVCRGVIDMDYIGYVLGEEEAIWLLKLVLPYLNEFLLKLKALFSGDPATTMKLAVLLFILARCGSSITIWTTAKLSFFGVFTVPKFCSLYSTHITAYANFWVRRFRDAWDSCSHKKGVTVSVFLLVWNLSSIIARIWAVFMLFVAFRYYQQNLAADDWVEDGPEGEETSHEPIGLPKYGPEPISLEHTKQKKRC